MEGGCSIACTAADTDDEDVAGTVCVLSSSCLSACCCSCFIRLLMKGETCREEESVVRGEVGDCNSSSLITLVLFEVGDEKPTKFTYTHDTFDERDE